MDFNPEYVRLWTRLQAEVGRYVLTMIPREDVAGKPYRAEIAEAQESGYEFIRRIARRLMKKWMP